MLLIYGDERTLDETTRNECYRESAQLAQDIFLRTDKPDIDRIAGYALRRNRQHVG